MKVESIHSKTNIKFGSKRTARNITEQLAKNNQYSLTEPNQRQITNSIKELAKVPGEKNVNFLLDTASKVKYSTNIKLKNAPKHNWKNLLLAAATTAALITPAILKDSFNKKINEIQNNKNLSNEEKEILNLRKNLLKSADLKQIKKETVGSIKDFEANLDYFIVSSETTTEHKKYVLEKLNYFMSDDYQINPQLKDKKSIALAEIVNDMALNSPEENIPNIKAVNQKQHGMCAAISIVRKKLAYEDKPNYIDAILSELDSTPYLTVYDRNKLFSKEKIQVQKVPVDFETALANGYRIIDASTMHWMQVAQMSGSSSLAYDEYRPFDKENFDVNKDAFYNVGFDDPKLQKTQNYFQALKKAESVLADLKANYLKKEEINSDKRNRFNKRISTLRQINESLSRNIASLDTGLSANEIQTLLSGILKLNKHFSDKINPDDKFSYIPNEETSVKKNKIKGYIIENSSIKDIPDEILDKIYDFVEFHSSLQGNPANKNKAITEARSLYNAAAAFRYQMIKGLDEETMLAGFIRSEGLKNKESLLLDTIDTAMYKIDTASEDSNAIIENLLTVFDLKNPSKENVLALLGELKDSINTILTDELDSIYEKLTIPGGRRGALITQLEGIKNQALAGDKESGYALKEILNIKKHSDIEEAVRDLQTDISNCDDESFLEIFDNLHNVSQIENIENTFNNLIQAMNGENQQEIISRFAEVNNIAEGLSEDLLNQILNEIGTQIQTYKNFIENLYKVFTVTDKDGEIIISPNPKDIIIKKWENEKTIIPAKDLKELQEHFTKISKDRSQDEFSTRQGKLHDKSLYQFSSNEKATLNEIKKNINPMFSYIQKQIPAVQKELKEPLEELKRIVGLHNGSYWVREEGHSGLTSEEEVRVLEYMTGRPHYETTDLRFAMEKIKNSPYSGISSSSVYDDAMGWHAQYIADIRPVKIKNKEGKEEEKEVLFHDNSWGASEYENTWVDSNGLTRTDYSDNRGGSLGYITNNKFQNGNFTDRILNDMVLKEKPDLTRNKIYKKLKHVDNNLNNLPQMSGIILEGYSPNTKSIAAEIHDAMFIPSLSLMGKLEKLAKELSPEEVKNLIKQTETAATGWEKTYNNLQKRLYSPFEKKIQTKEDYDKLPDNDYLKVVLEKVALKWNYQINGLENELAKVKNTKDLSKFRSAQKNRAINSFKYAFFKDINAIDFVCNEFGDSEYDKIDNILDKYNIKLTDKELYSIGTNFELGTEDFDGSVKNTVKLFLDSIKSDLDKVVANEEAKKEILNIYKEFFEKTAYFNNKDIADGNLKNIINFIDREYSPNDDEELVNIYRKLQDMTTEEFKKEVLSKVNNKDLGIKNYTGYDILKKLQRYESSADTAFMNTIYYDTFYANYGQTDFKKAYRYKRFAREAMYNNKYNVSSIYREMAYDLSYLTLPKLFNKYKDRNLDKYGAYPAYPKLEYLNEDSLGYSYNSFIDSLDYKYEAIKALQDQIKSYELANQLLNYLKKYDNSKPVTGVLYRNLNLIFCSLILNADDNDPVMEPLIDAAEKAMELGKGSLFNEYKPYINTIISTIEELKNTTSKEALENALRVEKNSLHETIKVFAKSLIQEKYRDDVISIANKYIQALIKYKNEDIETLPDELYEAFSKYHILRNPKELLEAYILSVAKDSPDSKYLETYRTLMTRGLQYAQLANIQDILMGAVSKGVETSVKDMFKNYKLHNAYGEETSMNSKDILAQMIHKLIIDNERETALMFIDKLGIGEDYIKYLSESIDFDNLKNILKEAFDTANNFNAFTQESETYLDEARELSIEEENYEQILDLAKNKILRTAKKHKINNKEILPLINALDAIKKVYADHPDGNRQVLFDSVMMSAKEQTTSLATAKVNNLNLILNSNATILDLVNQLLLKEDSEANKLRTEMNEKFKKLIEYKSSLSNLQQEE